MAALCLPSDHVFCDCRLSAIVQARIVRGLSANLTLPDYGWFARDTTKYVSAAQQCVARRRSQLTTTDTVADTAICACRMQRQVAEGQCPPTISSWRPTCPI